MVARSLKGKVVAVCCSPEPGLPKPVVDAVHLIENWGVEGDYVRNTPIQLKSLEKTRSTLYTC
jgi:hypothetical protein